jgi:DNA-binding response OmpR family regulator
MAKILITDDDVQLCSIISGWLMQDSHNVELAHDGAEALNRIKTSDYDLIILDIGMPLLSGTEVLTSLRSRGCTTPVLMLTGKDSVEDVLNGFNLGADDYLTKPFHGKVLAARVNALLRRPPAFLGDVLQFAQLTLDRRNYSVTVKTHVVSLLPKEFDLLEFFMRHPNRFFTSESLLNRVWASESDATVDAVTTCIKRLRKKIDEEGKSSLITTVRGAGYKLEFIE